MAEREKTQIDTAAYDEQASKLIDDAYTRLNTLLGGMQGVDFEKLFGGAREQIKARQTEKAPGRLESFALAFGSEHGARSAAERLATAKQSRTQKERDLMDLEDKLLNAKMQQEMQAGEAKKALVTLRERQSLEHRLGRLTEREQHEQDLEKESLKGELRADLEEVKAKGALDRVRERATAIAKTMGYDERVALKLLEFSLRSRLSRNMLTGRRDITDEEIAESLVEMQNELRGLSPVSPPGSAPKPTTPPPSPAPTANPSAGKSRAREAAERIAASKKNKK